MRVAAWVSQERDGLLREARERLAVRAAAGDDAARAARDGLIDLMHRAYVTQLSGGSLQEHMLEELRTRWSAGALLAAAQTLADVLRTRVTARLGTAPAHVQRVRDEITRGYDALREQLAPHVMAEVAPDDRNIDMDVQTAARAPGAPRTAEPAAARSVEASALTALLRARATTAGAARALPAARAILEGLEVTLLPSAADELIVGCSGGLQPAVGRLLSAGTTIAGALQASARHVAFGMAVVLEDSVEATIRAGSQARLPGLLQLDETTWRAGGDGLAGLPDVPRAVDPAAPLREHLWQFSAALQRPPLLGRDSDVERLSRLLADPGDAPVLVALHGSAGAGKTALVRAALAAAGYDDESAPVLWGSADPSPPTPYAAVAAMVRALAGAPAGHSEAPARLRRLVDGLATLLDEAAQGLRDSGIGPVGSRLEVTGYEGDELRALLPALVVLLGARDDADDAIERPSPRALRTGMRRALYLVAAALLANADDGRPAVLVIPGADGMDGPTRDAIAFAASRLQGRARVVLLSTSRLKLPATFESVFRVERLGVRALPASVATAFVAHQLGLSDPPPALAQLAEKGKGSPLALLHATRFAVETGRLRKRDGAWDLENLDARSLPARVDRLLVARIERLPEDARRLLCASAILGTSTLSATVDFTAVQLGMSPERAEGARNFLLEAGLLVRTVARPGAPLFPGVSMDDAPLVFAHPLVRVAAETLVSEDERASLHGIVADALEATLSTGFQAFAPTLARHHRAAGRPRDALEHLAVAARRSTLLDERTGALALARDGLELAGDDAAAAFPFHLELESLREGGPISAHREALVELVRAGDRSGDPRLRAHALARVARFNLAADDLDLAEQAARGAADLLRPLASTTKSASEGSAAGRQARTHDALLATASRMLAVARFRRRDFEGTAHALAEARRHTRSDDVLGLAPLEHQEAHLLLELGDTAGAVERLLRARVHRRTIADSVGEASCLDDLSSAYARAGRVSTALALLDACGRLRARIGDDAGRAECARTEAELLHSVGEDAAALEAADRALALARSLSLDRLEMTASLTRGRVLLRKGDVQGAEEIADAVRRRGKEVLVSAEGALLGARCRLARAGRMTGVPRDRVLRTALSRAKEAALLGEKHALVGVRAIGMATVADVVLAQGDPAEALPWVTAAAQLLDAPAVRALAMEDIAEVHARVLDAVGEPDEAVIVRARAHAVLEQRSRRLLPSAQASFWSVPARAALRSTSPSTTGPAT